MANDQPVAIRDVLGAAMLGVESMLTKAFRSATWGTGRPTTVNAAQYPAHQHAEKVPQLLESLSVTEEVHKLCPTITYGDGRQKVGPSDKPAWPSASAAVGLPRTTLTMLSSRCSKLSPADAPTTVAACGSCA